MELIILCIFMLAGGLVYLIESGNQKRKQQIKEATEAYEQHILEEGKRLISLVVLMRQSQFVGDEDTYKAIKEKNYEGQLPEKLDNGSWTSPYPQLLTLPIAGINYRSGIKNCLGPAKARLIADPKNEYDPNAIKVVHESGTHIGFIPADRTDDIRELLPCYAMCEIDECEDDLDHHHYFRGWLYLNSQPIKN